MRRDQPRYKGLREEDARAIAPEVFRQYVEDRGWEQTFKGNYTIYRRPGSIEFEVIVVNDAEEDAYTVRAIQAIHDIARFEERTPESVLAELIELSSLSEAEYQDVEIANPPGQADTSGKQGSAPVSHDTLPTSDTHSTLVTDEPER